MSDPSDYSVDDLIAYLHRGLTIATVVEMDIADLARLYELLHHWSEITEMELRNRAMKS